LLVEKLNENYINYEQVDYFSLYGKKEDGRLIVNERRVLIGSFLIVLLTLVSFNFSSPTGRDIAYPQFRSSNLDEAIVSISPNELKETNQHAAGYPLLNVNVKLPKYGILSSESDGVTVYHIRPSGNRLKKFTKASICVHRNRGSNTYKCEGTETDFTIRVPGNLLAGNYELCVTQCLAAQCNKEQDQKEVCSAFKIIK